ncbi:MAG: efflux transporter outer membrane subunit [Bacteroidales bacterium]|nr:efflux transporter outer membrane subunit [Bacteroidales bacterium]
MKKIILSAAAVLMLCSCGIYKKYERPAEIVTDSLYGEKFHTEDTVSVADMGWRELFTDPYLQVLIDSALSRNADVRTAALRVEQAETALKIARLSYIPSFNFVPEGAVSGFNNFETVKTGAGWTYTVPVAASWEIDIFGKKTNTKRQAQASADMARDYEQAVKTGLIAGVATQYYTLLMLDEQLRIAESTSAKFAESVRVLRAMMDAGMANEVAVAQMEGAWYQVEAAVEDIRKSINSLENSLSVTLYETPHPIDRGVLADASFPEQLKTGVPVALLSRRPDVRAAENSLASAYYAVNVARADLYPSLSLSGIAGWTNNLGGTVMNPAGLLLNAAGSLFQPIFNAGAMKGKVKIAEADRKAAEISFQQTLLNAGAEVNDALTQYQTALAKEEWRSRQVESLSKAVTKTEKLMQYTSVTYLEVLTAQQSLLQAETSQAQDTYEKITAVINLYHALGGGQ